VIGLLFRQRWFYHFNRYLRTEKRSLYYNLIPDWIPGEKMFLFCLFNFDNLVKSRFKDWIPAFAGKTPMISNWYSLPYCHSRAGGNPENRKIRLFTKPSTLGTNITNKSENTWQTELFEL
jgi:hypothetical protein